jgi:hypothetical protein
METNLDIINLKMYNRFKLDIISKCDDWFLKKSFNHFDDIYYHIFPKIELHSPIGENRDRGQYKYIKFLNSIDDKFYIKKPIEIFYLWKSVEQEILCEKEYISLFDVNSLYFFSIKSYKFMWVDNLIYAYAYAHEQNKTVKNIFIEEMVKSLNDYKL